MYHEGRLHPNHRDDVAQPLITGGRHTVALSILCLCALIAGVDMTITNVALPSIARDLDAPTTELQWTVDIYNIVMAGLLVLGGALADRQGRKRVFLASFAIFALGSTCAAFSPGVGALIASRGVMGIGAAGFTAPALAIIASMYEPKERSAAISLFVVFGATGLAVGPIIGGLLLDHFWWGAVFLVNVPIAVIGILVGVRTIPESRAPEPDGGRAPLDYVGALLSVLGLAFLLFGVIEGPRRGWNSPLVITTMVVGAVGLVAFIRRELHAKAPLFDVRILRRPAVATGSITLFVAYLVFNSFLFLNPQYLQDVRGESIVAVGLLLLPFAVVFGLCSLGAQEFLDRAGPRATLPTGLLVAGVAATLFAVTIEGPLWPTLLASVVLGAGLSLLIAPPSTVVMNDLPPAKAGDGSSLNFVSRFVGASIGIAIVGSVLTSIYARDVDPALVPLDPSQAETAQGSVQGALEVAETLQGDAGSTLATTAQDAFSNGATVAYIVVAVMCVVAAATAWLALGRAPSD